MIQQEFCSGQTLREFLDERKGTVDRLENLHLFKQLMAGLRHIHQRGLVHRDIKPSNVFISSNQTVKIGDFGLAKEIDKAQSRLKKLASLHIPKDKPFEL
mmetsp:Transcript_24031/g.18339  ORF Transcript_24031/g.18339 Transcript_24031/m.18339 type:complete len:100 (+) Transcript_24031:1693-1992(+)